MCFHGMMILFKEKLCQRRFIEPESTRVERYAKLFYFLGSDLIDFSSRYGSHISNTV